MSIILSSLFLNFIFIINKFDLSLNRFFFAFTIIILLLKTVIIYYVNWL